MSLYAWKGWQARQPEIDALKAEVAHWKANHNNMVNRSRVLIDRTDLPLERVKAFEQLETLKAENEKLRKIALTLDAAAGRLVDYFDEVKDCHGRADYGVVCELVDKLEAAMPAAMTAPDTKGE